MNAIPMAPTDPSSVWPVRPGEGIFNPNALALLLHKAPWAFGSPRGPGGDRRTIGPTLPCVSKDVIVAPLAGRVIARWKWESGITMLMLAAKHVFVGLGLSETWCLGPFGKNIGAKVEVGDILGSDVPRGVQCIMFDRPEGLTPGDFVMQCRASRAFFRWPFGGEPPAGLLDPTEFLEDALGRYTPRR